MIKLTPPHYAKVDPLLRKVPFNTLFARVVIEYKVDGQVYVDDLLNPTVSLIIHKYGMAFLCGNYENDSFNDKLVKFLKDTPWIQFPAKYMLTYPEQWEQKLASLLDTDLLLADNMDSKGIHHDSSQFFLQTQRINYKFNPQFPLNNSNLPAGFILKRIDADLYPKIQGSVVPEYFWDTAEDFLENGIGFSLLYDDQIVSTTFSSYIVDDQLELGVETTENFRKKGYAIYAASAMISYCLANGYEPVWACRRDNIGSSRLAESLGFVPASCHPYYCMPTR
ncbi:GNAT family N-acetyltransferase [Brevibacillus sp. SYSU BS000544]|uniref:GNAT family N-acetyltransferase n=1 Tax=Brevibacillus sp. SYSU BS000544 TaxID=3416443 RepID=UPI003CE4DAB0